MQRPRRLGDMGFGEEGSMSDKCIGGCGKELTIMDNAASRETPNGREYLCLECLYEFARQHSFKKKKKELKRKP